MNKHKRCFTPCPWSETRGGDKTSHQMTQQIGVLRRIYYVLIGGSFCSVPCSMCWWNVGCMFGWMNEVSVVRAMSSKTRQKSVDYVRLFA